MIKAPTDQELRAFAEAASKPNYFKTSFDLRFHNRCIFGHVKEMRGDRTYITDAVGRMMEEAVWQTGNKRLIWLIGIDRPKEGISQREWQADRDRRTEIAMRFKLQDAIGAVQRYFDPDIEESAIWPWAARGFKNVSRWTANPKKP